MEIMKEFKDQGFGAMISSDCHKADFLDIYFDQALDMLEACGFKERYVLTKEGFKAVPLR